MTKAKPRIVVREPTRTEGQLRLEWDKALEKMRKHVGKRVFCTPLFGGSQEKGVIADIDGRWVMVRFDGSTTPIRCCPTNLRLAGSVDTKDPLVAAGSTPS